jgi:nicotinate dehydrogenase subunit A
MPVAHISLKVNGKTQAVDTDPECPLLYVLRDDLAMTNPRFGCGLGQCGACTVIINNQPVRSCVYPVSSAGGKEITTLNGIGTAEHPHPVQKALIDQGAFQCGYCLNGWVMSAKALLDKTPHPTEAQIRTAFEGLVCRCGSHDGIMAAMRKLASPQQKAALETASAERSA